MIWSVQKRSNRRARLDAGEVVAGDAADLLHREDMLLVDGGDDVMNLLTLLGQADANRAAVDPRARMVKKPISTSFLTL